MIKHPSLASRITLSFPNNPLNNPPRVVDGTAGASQRFLAGLALIAGVVLCGGCGMLESPATPVNETPSNYSLLISYNRSTLGRTDYEQYRLVGNKLIWECGRISGGRYNPQTQSVDTVSETVSDRISELSQQLHRLVVEKGAAFDKPGSTPEFFDPGQFTLTLDPTVQTDPTSKPVTVRTTFDSVAVPQANREHLLNRIALAVRGVVAARKPCGIEEFYHLAKPKQF